MAVTYEWTVEEVDEHGDIQDVSFWDTPIQCLVHMRFAPSDGRHYEWGIKRQEFNSRSPFDNFTYAYIESHTLPEHFSDTAGNDATRVPARFHAALAKAVW